MKFHRVSSIIIFLFYSLVSHGQISHGGSPLFPSPNLLRSTVSSSFIEMPPINTDSLRAEEQQTMGLRSGFRFGYKFRTSITKGIDGYNYILPDGTRVWQVGIRSKGAYSLNLLFSEYYLPEGARLFIYNEDRSHIIGAFTSENNSGNGILPIQPVNGEAIIVEYTEPANGEEGRLTISEVNHDFLGFRNREPASDPARSYDCMTEVICPKPGILDYESDPIIHSTLLIMIDGIYACTATLLNNTAEDGTPYVLTASHCLNGQFTIKNPDYEKVAGTVIAFFNYERSICGVKSKGTEQMTLAGAHKACVIDTMDIALLRMNELPPDYYKPYYAGWNISYDGTGRNISSSNYPFVNIHHPQACTKKYGYYDSKLYISNPNFSGMKFYPYCFWEISSWTQGATDAGSSGSPLFDSNHRLIGGLSGGSSTCAKPAADYFFALFRGWEYGNNPANHLKSHLDPLGTDAEYIDGMDPYAKEPVIRLSNVDYNGNPADELVQTTIKSPESGFLFGHNSRKEITEFAEEFRIEGEAELIGAYFYIPKLSSNKYSEATTIHIYKGGDYPEERLASVAFNPSYTDFSTFSKSFTEKDATMDASTTECFVLFEEDVPVKDRFFISYEINYPYTTAFAVHNTTFSTPKSNTAWMKYTDDRWITADQYAYQPMQTSLAIQPLIRYRNEAAIPSLKEESKTPFHYDRNTGLLTLDQTEAKGAIYLYTISGQVIEKINLTGESTYKIRSGSKGSIAIVRLISDTKTYSGKLIY